MSFKIFPKQGFMLCFINEKKEHADEEREKQEKLKQANMKRFDEKANDILREIE